MREQLRCVENQDAGAACREERMTVAKPSLQFAVLLAIRSLKESRKNQIVFPWGVALTYKTLWETMETYLIHSPKDYSESIDRDNNA